VPQRLHVFRYDKRYAVFAPDEHVGGRASFRLAVAACDAFGLRVNVEPGAEQERGFLEVDCVHVEKLLEPRHGCPGKFAATDLIEDRIAIRRNTKPVGHVAEMTDGRRDVPFFDVSVQSLWCPVTHRFKEIYVVRIAKADHQLTVGVSVGVEYGKDMARAVSDI